VFEDGGQRRDFVHVEDVAAANLAALFDADGVDGALNVASGHPITLCEMAEILCESDGRGIRPEIVGGYRLGDVRHVVADPSLARRALGFTARVHPRDGLARFSTEPLRPTG
jgi:dTDP-L-rhamnose 4-epimerase